MPPPQGARSRSRDRDRARRSRSRSRDRDRPSPVQVPVEELARLLQNNVRAVGRLAELHRATFEQLGGLATLVANLQAQVAACEQVLVDLSATLSALLPD